jgi:hypothetical protein
MESATLVRMTILAEAVLEARLVEDLRKLGARGYMISSVRGESWRGVRTAEWTEPHLRVETFVDEPLAERIAQLLAQEYLPFYAMMVYQEPMVVTRSGRPPA